MIKKTSTALSGTLRQLLLSPKGALEGLVLDIRGAPVQVSMTPGTLDAIALQRAIGQRISVKATPDLSPKTKHGAHPVFTLDSVTAIAGKRMKATKASNGTGPLRGVVSEIHYARHGEPNGVILQTGEFIHLRPHGLRQSGLTVGAKVSARGTTRLTALGTSLLEATHVNGIAIK